MRQTAMAVALLALVACQEASVAPEASVDPAGWLHGNQPVSSHVIDSAPGAAHCGDQESIFLILGWPLGTAWSDPTKSRWYVRNPSSFLIDHYVADTFSADATAPPDARFTGYRNPVMELWLAPSDQDSVAYLHIAGRFERWPRSSQALECV